MTFAAEQGAVGTRFGTLEARRMCHAIGLLAEKALEALRPQGFAINPAIRA